MKYDNMDSYIEAMRISGSVLGVTSIRALCKELGDPQEQLKIIHVAGTNGKGSTSCLIRSGLMANGYRVGGFNSPSVFCYEEMIHVNEEPISAEKLWQLYQQIEKSCQRMVRDGMAHPTLFEIETAAAFLYFREEACDLVVLEVGLGGAEDATNVILKPLATVLTSISRDHWAILGDSMTLIAQAKAGIIKEGCPCISLVQQPEVLAVIKNYACKQHAPLTLVEPLQVIKDQEIKPTRLLMSYANETIRVRMLGYYQRENVALAIALVEVLRSRGIQINWVAYREGLEEATLPGRFEVIRQKPVLVLDGAHNVDAAMKLKISVDLLYPDWEMTLVLGIFKDKDYKEIVRELVPRAVTVITVKPPTERGLESEILGIEARRYCEDVIVAQSVDEGLNVAMKRVSSYSASTNKIIVVCGSLSFLREVKRWNMSIDY